jgi:hypothetical protein
MSILLGAVAPSQTPTRFRIRRLRAFPHVCNANGQPGSLGGKVLSASPMTITSQTWKGPTFTDRTGRSGRRRVVLR